MKQYNRNKGRRGEGLAQEYLLKQGYKIIAANWQTRFGELDIIASKNNTLHFVEVKLKVGERFGTPEEMINKRKIYQIRKTAEMYLLKNREIQNTFNKYQIDAVSIVLSANGSIERINHYENIEL